MRHWAANPGWINRCPKTPKTAPCEDGFRGLSKNLAIPTIRQFAPLFKPSFWATAARVQLFDFFEWLVGSNL